VFAFEQVMSRVAQIVVNVARFVLAHREHRFNVLDVKLTITYRIHQSKRFAQLIEANVHPQRER